MAASTAIYLGTFTGFLGLSAQDVTGVIIDSISFDNKSDEDEFMNTDSDVASIAFTNHKIDISIDGRKLSGTSFTNKVASSIVLTLLPNYLPPGYTSGGTTVIKSIKNDQKIGEYERISMVLCHYPKVV